MSKNIVPCGGFELGESLIMKDGKLDLAEGGSVTVDSALSATSTNPVQNKVINAALRALLNPVPILLKFFEWDGATENRDNFHFSGYVYTKLDEYSDAKSVELFLGAVDDGALYISYSKATKAWQLIVDYSSGDGKVFICSIGVAIVKEAGTYTINNQDVTIPSTGIYVVTGGHRDGYVKNFYSGEGPETASSGIFMQSSESPDKYFRITVNDAGTISAKELIM